MLYAVCIIIGIIIARVFWRQLVTAAAWIALFCVLYLFVRAVPALGLSSAWLSTFYGAGLVGFLVGVLVALKPIINLLVESDYHRAIDRARQDADRRRV
jgi:hypothetical protein